MQNKLQPESYLNFTVYEDSTEYLGVAQATMPDISFLTQSLSGAGISGNVEAVLIGMVDTMSLTLQFKSATDAAAQLSTPKKHTIELRSALQYWDPVNVERSVAADKYVLVVVPKKLSVGTIKPFSAVDSSGEYNVYRYAAYKDGETIWEIDPYNNICNIMGTDYLADVRTALGK